MKSIFLHLRLLEIKMEPFLEGTGLGNKYDIILRHLGTLSEENFSL